MIPVLLLYFLRLCVAEEPVYLFNYDSRVTLCDEASEAFVDISELRLERYNETISYLDGYMEFFQEFGKDTMFELTFEREVSGKYEILFSHEIYEFCEEVALGSESVYYNYLKHMHLPDECPFPPGKYEMKEKIISTDEVPVNSDTCGRYRIHYSYYNLPDQEHPEDRELMYCLSIKAVIEKE